MNIDRPSLQDAQEAIRIILRYLGEDLTREGIMDTPRRYLDFMREVTHREPLTLTTFNAEGMDEMITQANIPFYSLCEHHMAPFFGVATVSYVPTGRIVGLSKLARLVRHHAAGLQNQERITMNVAQQLHKTLQPKGVGVCLRGRHMCMEMRGVKVHDTWTTTTKLLGVFRDQPDTRAEFLRTINGH